MVFDEDELPCGIAIPLKSVTNPRVWAILRRRYLEDQHLIHDSHDPYHEWENAWGFRVPIRSWKSYWKSRRYCQYRVRDDTGPEHAG